MYRIKVLLSKSHSPPSPPKMCTSLVSKIISSAYDIVNGLPENDVANFKLIQGFVQTTTVPIKTAKFLLHAIVPAVVIKASKYKITERGVSILADLFGTYGSNEEFLNVAIEVQTFEVVLDILRTVQNDDVKRDSCIVLQYLPRSLVYQFSDALQYIVEIVKDASKKQKDIICAAFRLLERLTRGCKYNQIQACNTVGLVPAITELFYNWDMEEHEYSLDTLMFVCDSIQALLSCPLDWKEISNMPMNTLRKMDPFPDPCTDLQHQFRERNCIYFMFTFIADAPQNVTKTLIALISGNALSQNTARCVLSEYPSIREFLFDDEYCDLLAALIQYNTQVSIHVREIQNMWKHWRSLKSITDEPPEETTFSESTESQKPKEPKEHTIMEEVD